MGQRLTWREKFRQVPVDFDFHNGCYRAGCNDHMARDMASVFLNWKYQFCCPDHARKALSRLDVDVVTVHDPQGHIAHSLNEGPTSFYHAHVDSLEETMEALEMIENILDGTWEVRGNE